jgi:hypothetical protein
MPSAIKFEVSGLFSMPSSSGEVSSSSLVSATKGVARATGIIGNVAILVFSRLTVRGPVELVVFMWGNEATGFFNLLVPSFGGILHVAYKSAKGAQEARKFGILHKNMLLVNFTVFSSFESPYAKEYVLCYLETCGGEYFSLP